MSDLKIQIKFLKEENILLNEKNEILTQENKFLKHNLLELNRKFEQVLLLNEELRKENKELKEKVIKLETKVSKLEKELEKYKVKPNEPSGAKPDFEKENLEKSKIKSGQKIGHIGKTRLEPKEIHKYLEYKPQCCEHCGCKKIYEIDSKTKIITELEFQIVNIKETYHNMKCTKCGKETKPVSLHGTSKSPYGRNTQTIIAYLRSVGGMTLRPIENLFKDFFKFDITNSSISNNEIRCAKSEYTLNKYNSYLKKIQEAQFSHKDETSFRVNGQTNWIWVYDSIDNVFYRYDKTRSKSVVQTDFKENKTQISINDCYAAYTKFFVNQQICWAHLIRETKFHAEKDNATLYEKEFYKKFSELYQKAKEFTSGDPPLEERQSARANFENDLVNIMLSLKEKTEFLERICNRLSERLSHCFLFVEIKGLPSTNNQAERSIRPFVVHRKISFGAKSENGAKAKVEFKTIFENAKRQTKQLIFALDFLFPKKSNILIQSA